MYANFKKMDERLKKFLIRQTGAEEEEIIPATKIEEDLGIYGDDAMELIIAFGKAFTVDVSKFMAADYFSAEGDILLPAIFRALTGKRKQSKRN